MLRRVAVRDGWRRGGRHPSQVMPASGPRAWQFDRRPRTSTAASSRSAVAAKEAEERPAAAVSCTSALGDALLLAAATAHAWAALLQGRQRQHRPVIHGFLPVLCLFYAHTGAKTMWLAAAVGPPERGAVERPLFPLHRDHTRDQRAALRGPGRPTHATLTPSTCELKK